MRVAFDTNVLAYAEGVNGAPCRQAALELLQKLPDGAALVPVQVLGELFHLLVRKAGRTRAKARRALLSWQDSFPLIETSAQVLTAAADLSTDHQFGIWDAVVLSAAAEAGCRLLLSEDMQEGFTWRGVTIVNPFAVAKHELLAQFLSEQPGSA